MKYFSEGKRCILLLRTASACRVFFFLFAQFLTWAEPGPCGVCAPDTLHHRGPRASSPETRSRGPWACPSALCRSSARGLGGRGDPAPPASRPPPAPPPAAQHPGLRAALGSALGLLCLQPCGGPEGAAAAVLQIQIPLEEGVCVPVICQVPLTRGT